MVTVVMFVVVVLAGILCATDAPADGSNWRVYPRKDWTDEQCKTYFHGDRDIQGVYGLSTGSNSNFAVYRDHAMRCRYDSEYAAAFDRFLTRVSQGAYDQPAVDEADGQPIADPAPTDGPGGLPINARSHTGKAIGDPAPGNPQPVNARGHGKVGRYATGDEDPDNPKLTPFSKDGKWYCTLNGKTYEIDDSDCPFPLIQTERDGKTFVTVQGKEYEIESADGKGLLKQRITYPVTQGRVKVS